MTWIIISTATPGATALSKKVIQTDTGVPKDVTGEPGDVNTLTVVLIVTGAVVVVMMSALFAVWYIRRRTEAGTNMSNLKLRITIDRIEIKMSASECFRKLKVSIIDRYYQHVVFIWKNAI